MFVVVYEYLLSLLFIFMFRISSNNDSSAICSDCCRCSRSRARVASGFHSVLKLKTSLDVEMLPCKACYFTPHYYILTYYTIYCMLVNDGNYSNLFGEYVKNINAIQCEVTLYLILYSFD